MDSIDSRAGSCEGWVAFWIASVQCFSEVGDALDSSKGPDPEGIPLLIVKNCASAFALTLH
jgi:hypothetical protein